MISLRFKTLFAMLAFASTASSLHGHGAWAEETPDHRVVLRFGDYGKKTEKSPGPLDRLAAAKVWSYDANGKPVAGTAEKTAEYILLRDISAEGAAFAEITNIPVRTGGKNPPAKSQVYIRWQPAGVAATVPAMTLDLVPTGKPGEVRVHFRGAPLARAKVEVFTPGEKEPKDVVADETGLVRFDSERPGTFLFECAHREPVGGFHEGVAYAATNHAATLTFKVQGDR